MFLSRSVLLTALLLLACGAGDDAEPLPGLGSGPDATTQGASNGNQDEAVGGGGHDESGSACSDFCRCMGSTCSSQEGYPFTDSADCEQTCSQLDDEQRSCFSHWCNAAITDAAERVHLCEHAWGAFGLDECP